MKYDAHWQPLKDEDAQTALVFGFMRHAPASLTLDVWLEQALGRSATGAPLTVGSFWPRYPAGKAGGMFTEPDVVVEADDGQSLLVVVECKPAYGQHTAEQLAREAVDSARARKVERVAVVLVGADLGAPADMAAWEAHARDELAANGLGDVAVELRYSSWRDTARAVAHAAQADPAWAAYADDVLSRLRAKGVLDYQGAPVIDDLEGLTLTNAVEVVHRIMRTFRLLALTVHGHPRVTEMGLKPFNGGHALLRDGRSTGLPGQPEFFENNVLLVPYAPPDWPNGHGVFFAAWLTGEDGPHLEVGAFFIDAGRGELPWQFAGAQPVDELQSGRLEDLHGSALPTLAKSRLAEFVYAERRWVPGDGDADVEWIIDGLGAALSGGPEWQGLDVSKLPPIDWHGQSDDGGDDDGLGGANAPAPS